MPDKNNNTTKGQRRLKVYQKYFYRTYRGVFFPEIRLSGKWLRDLGFKCGVAVKVEHEQNKIIITVDSETENNTA